MSELETHRTILISPHHGPKFPDFIKLKADQDGGVWLTVKHKNQEVDTWIPPEIAKEIGAALLEVRPAQPAPPERHLRVVS